MSQNDFNLANQGFPSMRSDMNSALQALASNSAGATEPSTTYAYQWWYDETTDILKMRNADNDAWISFATFDQATDTFTITTDNIDGLTATATELNKLDGVTNDAASYFTASGALSNRNLIINGNFSINQRGVSGTVTLSAGQYGHDRWKAGASGCTYTFATVENVTTITITAGSLVQVIEGLNLHSGEHVLSWIGTAQGKIGAGSYGASGVTGSVVGGANLSIEFGTGTLSKAQLEVGDTATPFEHRMNELELCQRYFQKSAPQSSALTTIAGMVYSRDGTTSAVARYIPVRFVQTMRTSPTVTIYDGAFTTGNLSQDTTDGKAASTANIGDQSMMVYGPSGTFHYSTRFGFYLDAEL